MTSIVMKKNMRMAVLMLWSILLPLLHPHAQAAASEKPQLPPGVALRINVTPQTGTIGDPIRILFDVTLPKGCQALAPRLDKVPDDFSVLDFKSDAPEIDRTTGQLHHRIQLTTAVYKTGKFAFPALDIPIKTADDKEAILKSAPVGIEIRSVLTDKNSSLADLKKQAEIPEPIRWGLWIGIILAAAIIAFLMLFLRRRKQTEEPAPVQLQDSLALAEEDLRRLIAAGLPAEGREKDYYVRLSGISKRILETGYKIPVIEQTTDEIMDALRGQTSISGSDAETINSFLTGCDVVKFAKYIPAKGEQETAVRQALQILEQAKKQRTVANGQSAGSEN